MLPKAHPLPLRHIAARAGPTESPERALPVHARFFTDWPTLFGLSAFVLDAHSYQLY